MKNIHFEAELSDDRDYVYIITYVAGNKKHKVAIIARSLDEASFKLRQCEGEGATITGYEKITKAEYRQEKLT